MFCIFFLQAEDGIRYAQESRGLGDVYKRQPQDRGQLDEKLSFVGLAADNDQCRLHGASRRCRTCLLYTSDAADDLLCVDLGGRRIIKKKTTNKYYILIYTYHFHAASCI